MAPELPLSSETEPWPSSANLEGNIANLEESKAADRVVTTEELVGSLTVEKNLHAGGPSDPELTAPIDAKINVRGPLESLVKIGADLGTDPRLRFRGTK